MWPRCFSAALLASTLSIGLIASPSSAPQALHPSRRQLDETNPWGIRSSLDFTNPTPPHRFIYRTHKEDSRSPFFLLSLSQTDQIFDSIRLRIAPFTNPDRLMLHYSWQYHTTVPLEYGFEIKGRLAGFRYRWADLLYALDGMQTHTGLTAARDERTAVGSPMFPLNWPAYSVLAVTRTGNEVATIIISGGRIVSPFSSGKMEEYANERNLV